MTPSTRQNAPQYTQRIDWATVAVIIWTTHPYDFSEIPTHPPSHLSTWMPPPLVPSTRPHFHLPWLLATRSTSVCDLQPPFFLSPGLESLFDVPWKTPESGREFRSEEFRRRVTSKMYRPLIPGGVKDPSSRSSHGSNVWQIV